MILDLTCQTLSHTIIISTNYNLNNSCSQIYYVLSQNKKKVMTNQNTKNYMKDLFKYVKQLTCVIQCLF
jgi:hypothetical protein